MENEKPVGQANLYLEKCSNEKSLEKYTKEEINVFALRYLKHKEQMSRYIKTYRKSDKGRASTRKAAYYQYWKKKGITPKPYEEMRLKKGKKLVFFIFFGILLKREFNLF